MKNRHFFIAAHISAAIFVLALAVFLLSWSSLVWAQTSDSLTTSDLLKPTYTNTSTNQLTSSTSSSSSTSSASTSAAPITSSDTATATATDKTSLTASSSAGKEISLGIVSPSNNSYVSGRIKITLKSFGPVKRTEIYYVRGGVNPALLGSAKLLDGNGINGNLWEYDWNTGETASGGYTLSAVAWYDWEEGKEGKVAAGNKIYLTVNNQTAAADKETVQTSGEEKPTASEDVADSVRSDAEQAGESAAAGAAEEAKQPPVFELQKIAALEKLPLECRQAGITSAIVCETLMRQLYIGEECRAKAIGTKFDCNQYMQAAYGKPAQCNLLGELACSKLINQIILGDFIDQGLIAQANQEMKALAGKYLEINKEAKVTGDTFSYSIKEDGRGGPVEAPGAGAAALIKFLPLAKAEKKLGLLILGSAQEGKTSSSAVAAVVLIDSDQDGLPDDLEKKLGTDPDNPDTNGNGLSDGSEARSGQNPAGAGELAAELAPVEKAIINKAAFEQPKTSEAPVDEFLAVSKAIDKSTGKKNVIRLEGRAGADQTISLYIYSPLPIVMTVKTDANGNWVYELDKSLADGRHEAYVVINDEAGKIESRSVAFSFFVKEARAVGQNDFLASEGAVPDRTRDMTLWYLLASIVLIAGGIVIYFVYSSMRAKYNLNTDQKK